MRHELSLMLKPVEIYWKMKKKYDIHVIYFKYDLKKVSDILCCNENPLLKHLFNAMKFREVSGNLDCQSKVTCI